MELKYNTDYMNTKAGQSSNRTFMELKYPYWHPVIEK